MAGPQTGVDSKQDCKLCSLCEKPGSGGSLVGIGLLKVMSCCNVMTHHHMIY